VKVGKGNITDLSKGAPDGPLRADICVIGSGPAGATAAADLAAAGKDVLILEEGGDRTGMQLTGRDGPMYDQLYMDRGGRMTEDMSISVLQGRVLGGGGVINASDVVPMPAAVLAHWRKIYGLTELTDTVWAPFAAQALKDLSANPIPDEQLNRANRIVLDGARKLGLAAEVMHHNRVGCQGTGTCLIGCPINAKRNPRFVAIPKALGAGARVAIRTRAVRISESADGVSIACKRLDSRGYHEIGEAEVRCGKAILAANAIGSAHLLLRSGLGGSLVGRHLSLQPQLPVLARFKEPVVAFRGIPQAVAVTAGETADAERGLGGWRIEPIMGTPGIVGSLMPIAGLRAKELMTAYSHMAAVLVLVPDASTGSVVVGRGHRPVVRYDHTDDHKARLRAGAKATARIYLAMGALEVMVPTAPPVTVRTEEELALIDDLPLVPASAPMISAHQQGGTRMATSADRGVIDPSGRVYGTQGVYVFDSGGFPSTSSTHTMTPIIAMAHCLSARMLG